MEKPPYVLPGDMEALDRSSRYTVTLEGYEAYLEESLERSRDPRFHLGLVPQPFSGDLVEATVFILLLNPGINHDAYFAEHKVPAFRAAAIDNLLQKPNREFPLLFLEALAAHFGLT